MNIIVQIFDCHVNETHWTGLWGTKLLTGVFKKKIAHTEFFLFYYMWAYSQ